MGYMSSFITLLSAKDVFRYEHFVYQASVCQLLALFSLSAPLAPTCPLQLILFPPSPNKNGECCMAWNTWDMQSGSIRIFALYPVTGSKPCSTIALYFWVPVTMIQKIVVSSNACLLSWMRMHSMFRAPVCCPVQDAYLYNLGPLQWMIAFASNVLSCNCAFNTVSAETVHWRLLLSVIGVKESHACHLQWLNSSKRECCNTN